MLSAPCSESIKKLQSSLKTEREPKSPTVVPKSPATNESAFRVARPGVCLDLEMVRGPRNGEMSEFHRRFCWKEFGDG